MAVQEGGTELLLSWVRSPRVATKCVWRCRHWYGRGHRSRVVCCLRNLWRRKYRQSHRSWNTHLSTGLPGPSSTPGALSLQHAGQGGTPRRWQPLHQQSANPWGTGTVLVTFHPQHPTFMKHTHSRIQGKEVESQVGTVLRLSRKPGHLLVSPQHSDSTAFKASWESNFSHRTDVTGCSVMPGFQLSPQLSNPQECPPRFLTWTFLYSLLGETAPMILTLLGILSLSG